MTTSSVRRRGGAALAIAALMSSAMAAPALARQEMRASLSGGGAVTDTARGCAVQRIGRELVRCDSLTGAGVSAPERAGLAPASGMTRQAPTGYGRSLVVVSGMAAAAAFRH